MKQPGSSLILTASRKLLNGWGLRAGANVPLICGSVKGIATVQQGGQSERAACLNWPGGRIDLQQQGLAGQVVYSKGEGVRIGPIIGIMTTGVRRDLKKPIGGRTALLGDFIRASRELNVLCYVFNATDVNFASGMVKGVTLSGAPGQEAWSFASFPLPEVVYNRVPHRRAETLHHVKRCKQLFASKKVPLFNERFLNKNEMYRWLASNEHSRQYVPATDIMRSPIALERFCKAHRSVFLKPTGGSLGVGIYQVERSHQGYLVRCKREKRHVSRRFMTADDVYQFVKKRGNPQSTYMMQQGIRLMEYQGRKTDFRVHLHKNADGRWEAAGIGAKVAGVGAITTHVHNGGKVVAGNKVLRRWYGERAEQMRAKMIDVSILVADVIQGLLKGETGELGLDVGLDREGHVWVFETNAKPGRAIFRHPDLIESGKRSSRLLLEYATQLVKFPLARGGSEHGQQKRRAYREAR
ncbi:YheC/YheD family protein [Tumebacillus lipolyticus]|uniref:YheC/YheD family protein n=1 Tax=Tumebacillus lipolyticus TaxID=1280370 RepID=A0ABW5A079_9BACL